MSQMIDVSLQCVNLLYACLFASLDLTQANSGPAYVLLKSLHACIAFLRILCQLCNSLIESLVLKARIPIVSEHILLLHL